MEKNCLLLLMLLSSFYCKISAQDCLPAGITFSTQEQIDRFPFNYPGCTQILGDVHIERTVAQTINNLDSLGQIIAIKGDLMVNSNTKLTSLRGLHNLTTISGRLGLWKNNSLTNLSGLDNLTSIGNSFFVRSNTSLTSLNGLEKLSSVGGYLKIWKNATLTSLSALKNVMSIGGYLNVNDNDSLTDLSVLDNITSIGGDRDVSGNGPLKNGSDPNNLSADNENKNKPDTTSLASSDKSLESIIPVQPEKPGWHFGVGIGFNVLKLSGKRKIGLFEDQEIELKQKGNRKSFQGQVTARYNYNRHWRFVGALGLTHAKGNAYRETIDHNFFGPTETMEDEVIQKYLLLNLPISIRWQIVAEDNKKLQGIKPFIDLGLSINFTLINKSSYSRETTTVTHPLFGDSVTTNNSTKGEIDLQPLSPFFAIGLVLGEHFTIAWRITGINSRHYDSTLRSLTLSRYF